jgi:hypothetical protein
MVAGRFVVRNRSLVAMDIDEILEKARAEGEKIARGQTVFNQPAL